MPLSCSAQVERASPSPWLEIPYAYGTQANVYLGIFLDFVVRRIYAPISYENLFEPHIIGSECSLEAEIC